MFSHSLSVSLFVLCSFRNDVRTCACRTTSSCGRLGTASAGGRANQKKTKTCATALLPGTLRLPNLHDPDERFDSLDFRRLDVVSILQLWDANRLFQEFFLRACGSVLGSGLNVLHHNWKSFQNQLDVKDFCDVCRGMPLSLSLPV